MSLRQQLQDPGKKPVASQHFINKDKDGTANRHVCFFFLFLKNTSDTLSYYVFKFISEITLQVLQLLSYFCLMPHPHNAVVNKSCSESEFLFFY